MKSHFLISLVLFFFNKQLLEAQELKPNIDRSKMKVAAEFPGIYEKECSGLVQPPSLDLNYLPTLVKVSIQHNSENDELVKSIKAQNFIIKKSFSNVENDLEPNSHLIKTPEVGIGLQANKNTGSTPMDNTIAIGSNGWIVSGANSSINYVRYGSVQYTQKFSSFLNNTFESTCDPVVVWDPEFSKFFMYIQECGKDGDNRIALLFSKTSDPNDGWWFYTLKGDSNFGFFDYPKIGQSTNEFFVSGNVYYNSKYDHSNLFQIKKSTGYNGQTLRYTRWENIDARIQATLLPLNYGHYGTYGPGVYMVSTVSSGSNSIGFFDVTNDLDKSPQILFSEITTPSYGPGSDAEQYGSDCLLDVGDSRSLSGYYQNEKIHFVCNSVSSTKWSALGYFQLDVNTLQIRYENFGANDWDYAYPAIAFYGKNKTDNESMIFFQRSNKDNYPQCRVVYVNGNMEFSSSVKVYSSWEAECGPFGTTTNRWGDYSGICRNYSLSTPSVWVAGAYGDLDGYWNTYIAEVHDDGAVSVQNPSLKREEISLYPQPVNKRFQLKFNLPESGFVKINVLDATGRYLSNLIHEELTTGEHILGFEIDFLPAGNYTLQILQKNKIISNESFVVIH